MYNSCNFLKIKTLLHSKLFIGTFFLTFSGMLSRLIGFLYRIFLSREIGAEGLGLYQQIMPLFGLCLSVSALGMQSAISKNVADCNGHSICKQKTAPAIAFVHSGLFVSILLSVLFCFLLRAFSSPIAIYVLKNPASAPLLSLMAICLIPASIHACINGYYYGKKNAILPCISQISEQLARVFGVYLLFVILTEKGQPLLSIHAVYGILFGEIAGTLISVTALCKEDSQKASLPQYKEAFFTLLPLALPLTLTQTFTHLSSSIENLLLPIMLQKYGHSLSEAFRIYGVFSGMVMSVIFFPCVLTNSVAVILLPTISEANACKNKARIVSSITAACTFGTLFGLFFSILFFLCGNFIGEFVFKEVLAGFYIKRLAFLCPLLFIYALLAAVLNGLSASKQVLYISLLSAGIRIFFIAILVPAYGMKAVIFGMLLSQLFAVIAALYLARAKANRIVC